MADSTNVLFIVMDQFRADCLEGDLAAHLDLPNLRALMGEAVSFRRHYSVCAPCGPSRASLLTGQYAMNHRAVRNGTPLRHDTPTLATELRAAGRNPLLFGYTDSAQDPRALPEGDARLTSYEEVMQGFEEVVRMRQEQGGGPWEAHLAEKGHAVTTYPDLYRPAGPEIDDPALYAAEDSDTAFLTDRVIADLEARAPGWVAHVTYVRPHPPFVAPAPYNRMYDKDRMPAPLGATTDHPFLDPARAKQTMASTIEGFGDRAPDPDSIARIRAVYFGLATEVDHHIGRLIDWLKGTGRYDDTLIVVTSDHGELLGDYGCWGKSHYFDAAYHVPLIIRDPARAGGHGSVVEAQTQSVDVAPTILDCLGFAAPDTMDGASLRPFFDGGAAPWRGYSYSELDFGDPIKPTNIQTALGLDADCANLAILRDGRHTLVEFGADLPPILFDAEAGGEAANIADAPENAAIVLRLTRAMLRHRMQNPDGLFARTMITRNGPMRA